MSQARAVLTRRRNRRNSARFCLSALLILPVAIVLAGCDLRWSGGSLWGNNEDTRLGPRIVELGQPVPKGGGRYKVGAPYRVNGRTYAPEEISHYDTTGTASWYGEMFHGRRTANGEIYDMEALTAAHPTLPIPSYARVTNLRNGRSLVVRVNDRGPYASNRIIDLSWAVASLLQMRAAGTAPVRVQYLGPAPLSGDDGYERSILARQEWAGARVAYAPSPAKAMRYRQASADYRYTVERSRKSASVAALRPSRSERPVKVAELTPPARAPRAVRPKTTSHIAQAVQQRVKPVAAAAPRRPVRPHGRDRDCPADHVIGTGGAQTRGRRQHCRRRAQADLRRSRPVPEKAHGGKTSDDPGGDRSDIGRSGNDRQPLGPPHPDRPVSAPERRKRRRRAHPGGRFDQRAGRGSARRIAGAAPESAAVRRFRERGIDFCRLAADSAASFFDNDSP